MSTDQQTVFRRPTTVAEFIEALRAYPQDAMVEIFARTDDGHTDEVDQIVCYGNRVVIY